MNPSIEELTKIYSQYVSNQNSNLWTDPMFPIEVVYSWVSYTDGKRKQGTDVFRCPSEQFATDLIAKWHEWQELGKSEIKWEYKILSMRDWTQFVEPDKADELLKMLERKTAEIVAVLKEITDTQAEIAELEDRVEELQEKTGDLRSQRNAIRDTIAMMRAK